MRIFGSFRMDARDGQALLLATGELQAAVAHLGVVAERLRDDVVVNVRDPASFLYLLESGILVRVAQVLEYRAVEQVRLLGDHANLLAQVGQVEIAYVDARHPHSST